MIRKVPDGDYNWSLYGHVNKTRSHTSHQALTHFGHNKIFIMSTVQGVQAACEEIYVFALRQFPYLQGEQGRRTIALCIYFAIFQL